MKTDRDSIHRAARTVQEFVIPFTTAVKKLRAAEQAGKGVSLNKDEAKAIIVGFRMLKRAPYPEGGINLGGDKNG